MMRKFEVKRQLGKPNLRWDGNIRFDDFTFVPYILILSKFFSPENVEVIVLKQY